MPTTHPRSRITRLAARLGLAAAILACLPALAQEDARKGQDQPQRQPIFIPTRTDDPAFAQAAQRARATLPAFRVLLKVAGTQSPAGSVAMVKTDVSESDRRVRLWLALERDEGDRFVAAVFEVPDGFPSLKPGTMLVVPDAELTDWAVIDRDGLVHGAYTLRLQRARKPASERAAYDAHVGARAYAPLPDEPAGSGQRFP